MKLCTITECGREHYALGLCTMHWQRNRTKGDPNKRWAKEPVGWYTNSFGYRVGTLTDSNLMKLEHIAIVEKVLGYPLPEGAEVHHVDENPSNNAHSNLVVCQDRAYHKLLHARMRAKKACGNPNWKRCVFCKNYDDSVNMKVFGESRRGNSQPRFCHGSCRSAYSRGGMELVYRLAGAKV